LLKKLKKTEKFISFDVGKMAKEFYKKMAKKFKKKGI